jgi:hypothetical protein
MALSDKCSDALQDLRINFLGHFADGYTDEELSSLVDSMCGLAKFVILQDGFESPSENFLDRASNRVVIESMIEDASEETVDGLCKRLVGIAKHNNRLGQGIDELIKKAESRYGLFDAISEPLIYLRLQKLATYRIGN